MGRRPALPRARGRDTAWTALGPDAVPPAEPGPPAAPRLARSRSGTAPRSFALRWHLFALTAAVLLPIAIFGVILLRRIAIDEQAAMERRLVEAAEMLAASVDRELTATMRSLETLAHSETLERGDLAGFRREASRASATNPAWLGLAIFAPDGRRILDTRPAVPPAPSMEPGSLHRAIETKRPVAGDLMLAIDGQTWAYPIRVPVVRAGKVRYVLTAVVSAAQIGEVIGIGGRSDPQWSRMIVDRSGAIIARTGGPDFVGRPATAAFLARAAEPKGVFRAESVEGIPSLFAFTHAPVSNWTAAVVAPTALIDAPVKQSLRTLVAAALGILAFSIMAAFLASRRFSAGMSSLARASEALAHGGRAYVEPHRITEIAKVSEALLGSARLLEERRRESEENVARAAAARAEAERSSRAKDEFLAMLGHELRNPLSPIVTALQLLRQRGTRWGREHEIISRQVGHLVRLVDDLLDVSRVTRGKIDLHPERIELAAAVARAVEMASPLFEQRHHRLTIDVPAGLVVRADPARLAQIIANLLTNAARYTPPHGHVAVTGRREEDGIALSVTDDGQGIAPELLPRIFELFVQGPRAPDRAEGGLGIGLALVRTLVGLHGGRVEASSPGRNRGSTFRVILPPAAEVPETAPLAAPAARAAKPPVRRLRILVVDDNADAAILLTDFLSSAGHEVVAAHDAAGALAAVGRFLPDVAILDIGLPVMDGYDVAERIREKLGPAAPAFIGVTGYGQPSDREKSREAGFIHHFVKPANPRELLDAIEELAEATQLRASS